MKDFKEPNERTYMISLSFTKFVDSCCGSRVKPVDSVDDPMLEGHY